MYKVYIQTDEEGRILRCEGGVTAPENTDDWICVDEGDENKHIYCQNEYFAKGLFSGGVANYRYENGEIKERPEEEKQAELAAMPPAPPTLQEQIDSLHEANQYSFCKFDGLKYIADPERPIPLTLPMPVIKNMIYLYGGVRYVALKDGTATAAEFDGWFAEY